MKAKLIQNSNLPSKNTILYNLYNFKNVHFNFDEEKKFSNGNFSKILFYNPPNSYLIMVLNTKNGN